MLPVGERNRMNKNVERGQATRAHLIEVATRLFATQGYDGTSIEAVLAETGVSRGSLYHHFPGKKALFLAVLEDLGGRLGVEMTAAIQDAANPIDMLRIGCVTWMRHVDVFAHIVMATLNEVAMMIALASDSAATLKTGESAVNDLLDRLVGTPGRAAAG